MPSPDPVRWVGSTAAIKLISKSIPEAMRVHFKPLKNGGPSLTSMLCINGGGGVLGNDAERIQKYTRDLSTTLTFLRTRCAPVGQGVCHRLMLVCFLQLVPFSSLKYSSSSSRITANGPKPTSGGSPSTSTDHHSRQRFHNFPSVGYLSPPRASQPQGTSYFIRLFLLHDIAVDLFRLSVRSKIYCIVNTAGLQFILTYGQLEYSEEVRERSTILS